jgi:hypothetical protein
MLLLHHVLSILARINDPSIIHKLLGKEPPFKFFDHNLLLHYMFLISLVHHKHLFNYSICFVRHVHLTM